MMGRWASAWLVVLAAVLTQGCGGVRGASEPGAPARTAVAPADASECTRALFESVRHGRTPDGALLAATRTLASCRDQALDGVGSRAEVDAVLSRLALELATIAWLRGDPSQATEGMSIIRAATGLGEDASFDACLDAAVALVRADDREAAMRLVACLRDEDGATCLASYVPEPYDRAGELVQLQLGTRRLELWSTVGLPPLDALERACGVLCAPVCASGTELRLVEGAFRCIPERPSRASDEVDCTCEDDCPPECDDRPDAYVQAASRSLRSARIASLLMRLDAMIAGLRSAAVDHALIAAVPEVLDRAEAALSAGVVPRGFDPELFAMDVQLELPQSREPAEDADVVCGDTPERLVVVRSDGVHLATRPVLRLVREGEHPTVQLVDGGGGLRFPGRRIVSFEIPGAVPVASMVDGMIPSLAAGVGIMDIDAQPDDAELAASLLVDGHVYTGTLWPILRTLHSAGFTALTLHTDHAASARLGVLPVRTGTRPAGEPVNTLVLRDGGFRLLGPGEVEVDPARVDVGWVGRRPLRDLADAVDARLADGRLDPTLPLWIRLETDGVDYGILSHTILTITWRRASPAGDGDAAWLRAPIGRIDGAPLPYFPQGIFLDLADL